MKNKEKENTPRSPAHLSSREKQQTRWIIIGFAITALLIIGMVGYALLYDLVFKEKIPVAKIENKKIDNTYFIDRVRLERNSMVQQYSMVYSQSQYFAEDESLLNYFYTQLAQIQQMLDDYQSFGENALNETINDEVIAIEAEKLGISVSPEEVERTIQEFFYFYPSGTPTPVPTEQVYPTPTLSKTQESILKDNNISSSETLPEETDASLPSNDDEEDVNITEDQTEDQPESDISMAKTAIPNEPEPEATITPTATPFTLDLFQEEYQKYISEINALNISEESFRTYIGYYLLRQKVREQIVTEVPREQEQVWARHILVATESEADAVLERIQSGEDFSDIAREVSLDTSNKDKGGDLGWFTLGKMVEAFEKIAFDLEVGDLSEPVETQFGWHIIQVIGHDVLPLSTSDYENAKELYFQNWLDEVKSEKEISINEVWKDLVPSDPTIPAEYRLNF
jgi:peptidyl-prolyl cis-trans isomerase D